jgi:hypothetical protein
VVITDDGKGTNTVKINVECAIITGDGALNVEPSPRASV